MKSCPRCTNSSVALICSTNTDERDGREERGGGKEEEEEEEEEERGGGGEAVVGVSAYLSLRVWEVERAVWNRKFQSNFLRGREEE
jgi:hypothetical protein